MATSYTEAKKIAINQRIQDSIEIFKKQLGVKQAHLLVSGEQGHTDGSSSLSSSSAGRQSMVTAAELARLQKVVIRNDSVMNVVIYKHFTAPSQQLASASTTDQASLSPAKPAHSNKAQGQLQPPATGQVHKSSILNVAPIIEKLLMTVNLPNSRTGNRLSIEADFKYYAQIQEYALITAHLISSLENMRESL